MYFIVVIVNAKCVQADQKDTFITIAMRCDVRKFADERKQGNEKHGSN